MSVLLSVPFVELLILLSPTPILVALLVNAQFSDHVQTRFISQLIDGMSNAL